MSTTDKGTHEGNILQLRHTFTNCRLRERERERERENIKNLHLLQFTQTHYTNYRDQGGKPDTGKFHSSYIGMNVCGSAYENGCVVDGMCAMAAY